MCQALCPGDAVVQEEDESLPHLHQGVGTEREQALMQSAVVSGNLAPAGEITEGFPEEVASKRAGGCVLLLFRFLALSRVPHTHQAFSV